MLLPLLILVLISATGLLLFLFDRVNRLILNSLIGLWAGSMLAVSLVHIFPEALEQTQYAVYAFMVGFLLIYLIEEILTPHIHDHGHGDHTHEDPHEHYDHVALVSFIAIFVHTLFDGFGIRAGFAISTEVWYTILIGIAIHQIPVSLSLAALFRESRFQIHTQIIFVILVALAAPISFVLSDIFFTGISWVWTGLIAAMAGGSLLYVATADLLPVIHGQKKYKYATVTLFFLGAIGMSMVKYFE